VTEQMPFPDQIAHKPVFALPYNAHDPNNPEDSDVQWLSIGWSQWDEDEPSAKVVRFSGKRWSRQSEEMPLARLVDLVTVLAHVYAASDGDIEFEPNFFERQTGPLKMNRKSQKAQNRLIAELHRDETLQRRFAKLADVVCDLRNRRRI
jgi:Family of unknown function (DUF6530)